MGAGQSDDAGQAARPTAAPIARSAPSSQALPPSSTAEGSGGGCPHAAGQLPAGGCPVRHDDGGGSGDGLDARNRMPVRPEQRPHPNQRFALPTQRVTSAIPTGDNTAPHQSEAEGTWVYPSEQQFYNAMRRKGWEPREEDMKVVVAIHNAVNDQAWRHVLRWEETLHCRDCEVKRRLLRFEGKPKEPTPKARMYALAGYALPFDRHDWVVDRCGEEVRYVIDFYRGKMPEGADPDAGAQPMFLDVRPALDTPGALFDRLRFGAMEALGMVPPVWAVELYKKDGTDAFGGGGGGGGAA